MNIYHQLDCSLGKWMHAVLILKIVTGALFPKKCISRLNGKVNHFAK